MFYKKYQTIIIVIALLASIGVAFATSDVYVSGTWRYKLTVTVETPEGIKSGSSVYEMSNSDTSIKGLGLPESGNPATIRGEAIMIDLDKGGIVFGLIPSEYLLYSAIPVPNGGETTPKGIRYYKNLKDAKVTLNPNQYPTMVTFTDIKDPKTVTLAYGNEFDTAKQQTILVNRLEELFGAGVKIKDVTIQMTDEPVTHKIDGVLGWLPDLENKKARLNGSTSIAISTNELSDNLGAGSFKIGR